MDTSNSTFRPIDFITERVSAPKKMKRRDYADLFDAINERIKPYLSAIGLTPIEQITDRIFAQQTVKLLHSLQGTRLALVYQGKRDNSRILAGQFIHEVYLTEQGEWAVVKTWQTGPKAMVVIRTREDFIEYYDNMAEEHLLHPDYWLIDGPRAILGRTIKRTESRLEGLRELDRDLGDWNRRYGKVNGSKD